MKCNRDGNEDCSCRTCREIRRGREVQVRSFLSEMYNPDHKPDGEGDAKFLEREQMLAKERALRDLGAWKRQFDK